MRVTVYVLVFLILVQSSSCVLNVIKDLLQFNVAGHPVLHQTVEYPFDPDVGPRMARLYQEVNGVHGEKAIERLGLGIDGYFQERLLQQQKRDYELLGQN